MNNSAIKQVTAAIIMQNGKVLIAQRAATDRLALKWEFPGGKVEAGETPQECLMREIKEELGLDITVAGHYMTSVFRYETGIIELMAFFSAIIGGTISLNVHADAQWVSLQDLVDFDFAPADVSIVQKLVSLHGPKTRKR